MGESTRPLPPLIPLPNGGWEASSYLTSPEYSIRALGLLPANTIIPVIVVPGIMGSNLRAKRKPRLGRVEDERNRVVDPGEPVWRPPNGVTDGIRDLATWDKRQAKERQLLLDPATLEVDDGGPVGLPDDADDGYVLTEQDVRARGWGAAHADSYGGLLFALQTRLNQTFGFDDEKRVRFIRQHWKDVMKCDPRKWGIDEFKPLTEADLEKHARNYYPTYFYGYNWLHDANISSSILETRIVSIIDSWRKAKRRCEKVILVTHSMGGLVARACAKRIPEKIAGVIHGVMPALGAPVAYRRIACGTETSNPSNGTHQNIKASAIARILGETPAKTTPVLATSPGALELLPNHLYPQPWLHVRIIKSDGGAKRAGYGVKDDRVRYESTAYELLHFPNARLPNPYDLYRDTTSWYRLINPKLVDPADKYVERAGGVLKVIESAIDTAEAFHRSLANYYHPNTYVFFGNDRNKLSFGHIRWTAHYPPGVSIAFTPANLAAAHYAGDLLHGKRRILVEGKAELHFVPEPQDAAGDGTVPHQSNVFLESRVKQAFATTGYDHQDSYKNDDMLMLTLRLIAKIVQEMS